MTCTITSHASGPCFVCHEYQQQSHCSEGRIYCAAHCPVHGADKREWGELRKSEGEQMELIGGMKKAEEYPG